MYLQRNGTGPLFPPDPKSHRRMYGRVKELEDGEEPDRDNTYLASIHPAQYLEKFGYFSDGFDEDLLGDAADRTRLESLSELELESELYERSLRREQLYYKWGVKCILDTKLKQHPEPKPVVYMETKERSGTRRLSLETQRVAEKRRPAVSLLLAQRNGKKSKDDRRTAAEYQDNEQQPDQTYLNSIKPKLELPKKLNGITKDIYSDESSHSNKGSPFWKPEPPVINLKELNKALLTRAQLESFLDKPIFEQTVVGCFVRISLGGFRSHHRLTRIVAVEQIEREYWLGNQRTRRVLQVQHGIHQRSCQMDVVSNQPVVSNEFGLWMTACQRDAQPLPSLKYIAKKEKDIEKAANYAFTKIDVQLMVQAKLGAGQKPVGATYRKVCLIMERDMAVACNEMAKASQLDDEIKRINKLSHQRQYIRFNNTASSRISAQPATTDAKAKAKAKKFDWQQHMRRRYRKFAYLSSLQHQQQHQQLCPAEANAKHLFALHPVPVTPAVAGERQQDIRELDLYELHNFKIDLDVSKLKHFSEIFKEIESISMEY